ncbi:phosphatase PAP2 family protein [Streptacidiphilus sp. EB129]|uniref:phosphatase PAP2 family protein n=1 Tax=Streptacidiphilus sp. EB129 TaxID=3156262 RepID=UPI0035152391
MTSPRTGTRGGRWQLELLLVAALYLAYDGSRLLVDGGFGAALGHARGLVDVGGWWHSDPGRRLNAALSSHQWIGIPAGFSYATLHYLAAPAVLVWLWKRHRQAYRQARTWLAISTVPALVGLLVLPTMPSLHIGWALWCGLMIFRCSRDRTVRVLGLLYPLVITLVVLGGDSHRLLDCLAGTLLLAVGGLLTRPALRLTDQVRDALQQLRTRANAKSGSGSAPRPGPDSARRPGPDSAPRPAPGSAPRPAPDSAPLHAAAMGQAAVAPQQAPAPRVPDDASALEPWLSCH